MVTQCPGRLPSTMLKVVKAEPKNGDPAANVVEGQVYKLFMVGPQEIFRLCFYCCSGLSLTRLPMPPQRSWQPTRCRSFWSKEDTLAECLLVLDAARRWHVCIRPCKLTVVIQAQSLFLREALYL